MVIYWEGVARHIGFSPIEVGGNDNKSIGLTTPVSYQPIDEPKPKVSTLMEDFPPIDPSYRIDNDRIIFQTSFGEYTFARNRPSMSFSYRDGTSLIKHSAFYVNSSLRSPVILQDYSINMSSLRSNRLEYSATLKSLDSQLGTLQISVLFDRVLRPKITVKVDAGAALTAAGFNVVWVVRGYGVIAKLKSRPAGFDFTNVTLLNHSWFDETSVEMGPSGPLTSWRVWALVDWKDTPAGAKLGFDQFSGLQDMAGPAAMVIFPTNLAVIDPTVVAQSTLTGSAASYQRRVFFDGTKYWAFYHDGSNTVYRYSSDGNTWSSANTLWSYQKTAIWYGLGSVYALAGTLSQGTTSATTYLYFRKGTISGSAVNWGQIISVNSYTYSDSPATTVQASYRDVNVVVGIDGLITIIFTKAGLTAYQPPYPCPECAPANLNANDASGLAFLSDSDFSTGSSIPLAGSTTGYPHSERLLQVEKSLDAAGGYWGPSTTILSQATSDRTSWDNSYYPILSQLPNNQIMGIYSDLGTVKYSTSSSWTTISTLASTVSNDEQFGSAVSDSSNVVRFVWRGSDSTIKFAYYNGTWSSPVTIASATSYSPTIALGYGKDLYVFYLQASGGYYYVCWVRYSSFSGWFSPTRYFYSTAGFQHITTEANATTGLLLAEWTWGSASPYSIMIISLPIESAWSPYSVPSDPWDREGLIPYGHYFRNLQEYVSPSTGLLTIAHTDLALPGRGFDGSGLSVTRVFRTPYTFLAGSPYNYESYPYANLGLGWSFNWPWLGSDYVHLSNGQGYKIVWTNGVFENHQGDHFKLTMNTNGTYTLYDNSGTISQFDANKRLAYMLDRTRSNRISFTYDTSNRISYLTDTVGRTVTFTYDTNRRLSTVNSGGRVWTYGYNGNGNLISVRDPLQRTTSYAYTSSYSPYLLTKITYPTGAYTNYAYAQGSVGTDAISYGVYNQTVQLASGTVVRQVILAYALGPANGTNTTLTFNNATTTQGYEQYLFTSTNATRITKNSLGQTMRKTIYIYNGQGAIKKEIIFLGSSASNYTNYFNFDSWGNMVYQRLEIDASSYRENFYSYVNTNTQNKFIDYNGNNVTGFSNSFFANSVDLGIHDRLLGRAEYQNGAGTNKVESYFSYDSRGSLLQQKNLLGATTWVATSFTYDAYGNALTRTDAEGNQTTYQYSPTYQSAYPTTVNNIVNGLMLSMQYAYNFTTGDRTTVTSPSGNVTDYRYDMIGRLLTITYPSIGGTRAQRRITYDDTNNMATVYDERGNYTKYYYDGLARLTKMETYSTGSVYSTTNYAYYWNDKTKTFTDPTGNVTTYNYDLLGRMSKLTHPDGTFRQWSYDDINLIVNQYDEKNHLTAYSYDWMYRLVKVTEYLSGLPYSTVYTYDRVGNLQQINTALNQVTTNTYDSLNRLVRVDYPDSTRELHSFDKVGNLLSKVTQNNTLIQYRYDQINRLTSITYPDLSAVSYTYDKDSNRVQMTDPASTTQYTYDARNRPLSETRIIDGQSYPLGYQYDSASNLLRLTYPDGYQLTYSYDALNRITGVGNLATLTYRKDNRVSTIAYGNGVQTNYSYDKLGRISRILSKNGANTLLDLSYAYDPNGNLLTVNTNQEIYSYDDLNRLSTANGPGGSLSYTYDIVGNRLSETVNGTSTPYTIGSYNKLSSAGTTSFTYDNNGNRLTKNDGTNSWSYSYDYENRMKQVTLNGQQVFQAWYDGDGRRIKTAEGLTTTVLHYRLGSWDPVYQKDAGSGVVTKLIFAGNFRIGKLEAAIPYYYHLDRLGSVGLVTDNGINQPFTTKYKPYGAPYATSGNPERFTYTGKRQDSSTSLYYYGYRYYDSQVGRFTSLDDHPPDRFHPQTIDRYAYSLDNPVLYVDPDGRMFGIWDPGFGGGGGGFIIGAIAIGALYALGLELSGIDVAYRSDLHPSTDVNDPLKDWNSDLGLETAVEQQKMVDIITDKARDLVKEYGKDVAKWVVHEYIENMRITKVTRQNQEDDYSGPKYGGHYASKMLFEGPVWDPDAVETRIDRIIDTP